MSANLTRRHLAVAAGICLCVSCPAFLQERFTVTKYCWLAFLVRTNAFLDPCTACLTAGTVVALQRSHVFGRQCEPVVDSLLPGCLIEGDGAVVRVLAGA